MDPLEPPGEEPEEAARSPLPRAQDAGREHRLQQQGRPDRDHQGEGHGESLVAEERPGDAGNVDHRKEDRDRRQTGRHHRARHLAGALVGGKRHLPSPPEWLQRRVGLLRLLLRLSAAHREMTVDVLEHHDRVVDQHAGRQRQPTQTHQRFLPDLVKPSVLTH